jgi:hypothetical protein
MRHTVVNGGKLRVFGAPIPEDSKFYKLRITFQDKSIGDFDVWRPLPILNCSDYEDVYVDALIVASEATKTDMNTISGLIYFITVATIALVLKSIAKIIQKYYGIKLM